MTPEANPTDSATALERATQLFRFLKAYAERNAPITRSISEQLWRLTFRDLPDHSCVAVGEVRFSQVTQNEADQSDDSPLLRVSRPKLTPSPPLPESLLDFVSTGWRSADGNVELRTRNTIKDGVSITESLSDDPQRVIEFNAWKAKWDAWAAAERPAVAAMRVFERLYELHGRIERESEQVELMIGDGRLRWNQGQFAIDHPILLQRVELEFDASGIVPEFRIIDADRGPELYGAIILSGETISAAQYNQLRSELELGEFHPLAKEATSGYLRQLAQLLGPRGTFREEFTNIAIDVAPVVLRDPVLFLRRRLSGYAAAFDRILIDLESRTELPASLTRVVGIEPPVPSDTIEENASPWGEPLDVLLSKPANDEQVQIARALERHKAVLVQGPPGTGKSHTIANLIGHLVAHGKKVLVTSHATKALRVLRDQVVDTLKPLSVAVLENDLLGRQQLEEAVSGILTRLTHETEDNLGREAARLAVERTQLSSEIVGITKNLRAVREAEYLPIVIGGESMLPSEAARWLGENNSGNDWITGPIDQGSPLPLNVHDLNELYDSNEKLSSVEEVEIEAGIPDLSQLMEPDEFKNIVKALEGSEPENGRQFWERDALESDLPAIEMLCDAVGTWVSEFGQLQDWQRSVVAAGYAGGTEHDLWIDLARQAGVAADAWNRSRSLLLENEVTVADGITREEVRGSIAQIGSHLNNGGSLGWLQLATKSSWKRAIGACRVNGQPPHTVTDFRAITAQLNLEDGRSKLGARWRRQAEPVGLPSFETIGPDPEPILREYTSQFENLLSWWERNWTSVNRTFLDAGFRWNVLRNQEIASSSPAKPFDRDVSIVRGRVQEIVDSRLRAIYRVRAGRQLGEVQQLLRKKTGPACTSLKQAIRAFDVDGYGAAYQTLANLITKVPTLNVRRELLSRLEPFASEWATAIRRRQGVHGLKTAPGSFSTAWRWRQLQQETDRRAELNESSLTTRLYGRRDALRTSTAQLIDRRAWLGQLRRTDLHAKQALQGWADTQRKIGKGTGKRVPALQAEARRLLTKARDAVPVWIMPLARVAESFDATKGRFDVVIVDEASQSDMTGLLAWYLGDRVVVVGDHEQVSPMAVGQDLGVMQGLISQYLINIPNNHLYDGGTSIYDLARQSFGGVIALREHFRCVPDIIEFSNELSYNLAIRPLRDPSSAPKPHVLEYVVQPELGSEKTGKKNVAEARAVVALIKAITEMPEYEGKTIGAISLLGDEQADVIQDLAATCIGAVELERRRFVAGNASQFQGDERDVIFLSMVDTPTGSPLALRQIDSFKQRFNVAVSRAKDQLWLIHSLDPNRDLKAGDLRRRLIEYVRDPGAKQKELYKALLRAESPFETAVIQHLSTAGFSVEPQVVVGRYRIDMVISDGPNRVALECDGDRFHSLDQIPIDMMRQAVLERAGWRFVRVRGTRFYRDPEGTMKWVVGELARLGVKPSSVSQDAPSTDDQAKEFRSEVVRRAWKFMREQEWLQEFVTTVAPSAAPEAD